MLFDADMEERDAGAGQEDEAAEGEQRPEGRPWRSPAGGERGSCETEHDDDRVRPALPDAERTGRQPAQILEAEGREQDRRAGGGEHGRREAEETVAGHAREDN